MAGSYRHITTDENVFRGVQFLDNLCDAYEALEECYLMIQWLTQGEKAKIHEAWREGYFKTKCPPENLPMATYERFWEREEA